MNPSGTSPTPPTATPMPPHSPQRPLGESQPADPGLHDEPEDPWSRALTGPPRLATTPPRMPSHPATPKSGNEGREPKKHVDYRLDPAPSWGGEMPEKQFREYQRNLQLWLVEAEARLPLNLIGKRIIDAIPLGSRLSSLVAHLTVEEICSDTGHKTIVQIIEDAHEYLKDQRLEQAFDEAIFRGRRDKGMSLTTFLTNKKAAFAELRKQGLDLLATPAGRHLLGHLILRQGSFSQDQRQRLKVVTNGSIDFREIEMAIQKVFGDRLDELSQDHGAPHRRWRSATYWGDNEDGEIEDEDWDYDVFESELMDPFEDLICMNENEEAQMVFQDELPVIMDEADALEAVSNQIEENYYETQNRMQSKGKGFKGKGKKGKSKSPTRTYGQGAPSFGSGKGGGYLEHRRLLQASRNGRGYDRPWTRTGSRMSLNDLKAKTRCHTCKQVGHWSKECPHRAKTTSPTSRSSSSTGAMSAGMSTGFFIQPPAKLAGAFLTTTTELETKSKYIAAEFTGLSFVFLAVHEDQGTALVDTAAQHGLVGRETLEQHDTLLQERFGLRVQWSHEAGGSVRGVCGKEESTSIAYVPIGLGGKSGVLRVQVVPGTIPFLIPAYFLSNVGAVIDMEHAVIWYTKLATSQNMRRLSSGHVSVSIIDFGKNGFNVPSNFAASSSQAWSVEPIPDWAMLDALSHYPAAMVPLAALVAALSTIGLPSSLASAPGSCANTPTSRSPLATTEQRAFQLAQEEQRVPAEAHVTTPSALTGSLAMARREERVRPLAMVKGQGRFLVPALEPSPGCTHPEAEVKHAANRVLSWQECNQCQQKQIMPLTPITELHNWNQNLVYIPDVFYDVRKKSTKSKKGSSDASSPLQRAHPEPWPTSPRHDHRWSNRRSSRIWTRSGRTRTHGAMWWRTTC